MVLKLRANLPNPLLGRRKWNSKFYSFCFGEKSKINYHTFEALVFTVIVHKLFRK